MITGDGEEMCMSPGGDNSSVRGEDASHSTRRGHTSHTINS
ncbi:MAG: hypothetical protein ACTHMM_16805 [Agriterribacter sp.]